VESVGCDLLKEFPTLLKRQAIVAGAVVNTPVSCRVRRRIMEHGAEDVDAPAGWLEWFEDQRDQGSDRDEALPFQTSDRRRGKLFKT
jgi:hypothetical protein